MTPPKQANGAITLCDKTEEKYYTFLANRKLANSDKPLFSPEAVDRLKNNLREHHLSRAKDIVSSARIDKPKLDAEQARLQANGIKTCLADNSEHLQQHPSAADNYSRFCTCMVAQMSDGLQELYIAVGPRSDFKEKLFERVREICQPKFFDADKN